MTKRQFSQIERTQYAIKTMREGLPKDDSAREYLYRAEMALSEMLRFTVPNPR